MDWYRLDLRTVVRLESALLPRLVLGDKRFLLPFQGPLGRLDLFTL